VGTVAVERLRHVTRGHAAGAGRRIRAAELTAEVGRLVDRLLGEGGRLAGELADFRLQVQEDLPRRRGPALRRLDPVHRRQRLHRRRDLLDDLVADLVVLDLAEVQRLGRPSDGALDLRALVQQVLDFLLQALRRRGGALGGLPGTGVRQVRPLGAGVVVGLADGRPERGVPVSRAVDRRRIVAELAGELVCGVEPAADDLVDVHGHENLRTAPECSSSTAA
jgi:hypothetical protein